MRFSDSLQQKMQAHLSVTLICKN